MDELHEPNDEETEEKELNSESLKYLPASI
jgi:hypothetical protein